MMTDGIVTDIPLAYSEFMYKCENLHMEAIRRNILVFPGLENS